MKNFFILCFAAVVALLSPAASMAAPKPEGTFNGIVQHVSTENIKVMDPKTKESLSFLLVPKFNRVFSSDGKTTTQMSMIKPGQYVKVYYDQKALGARHADRILLLTQANTVKAKQ